MPAVWQFGIDVGGTFTDCFAVRPDGGVVRAKVLSSGVTKGAVGHGSAGRVVIDWARCGDPDRFWEGYRLRLIGPQGEIAGEANVVRFDRPAGRLELDRELPGGPMIGQPYELHCDDEAPLLAIRYLLGRRLDEPLPPVAVRLGTTRGTNALITRRGAATAWVTTRGFGDILHIGYQNRPRLFELAVRKREPLFTTTVEIDERITPEGTVLKAPDREIIRQQLIALQATGVASLAICLLHGSQHPAHEQLVAEVAREAGFDEISVSHQVAPLVKIVARGDTTVMDAYLNPILRQYVAKLRRSLGTSDLRVLTSAGGLVEAERFVGKDSILSGPAGGVVGFSRAAVAAGFFRAIGFDMGGTSTDVARFDGRYELEYETEKAGVRVVAPMMSIETVAAGGGSICHFDGVKLAVGPDSAGADPGPACYGRGGPLAVTDLNFYLGKIQPAHFPFPLDRAAVQRRLALLADDIAAATGQRYTPLALADGFLRVANANMVKAIRSISIARGYDPRDYVLVAFGGAAGQHACAVARELGMRQVLSHPDAGILSAYGIAQADVVRHGVAGVYQLYSPAAVADLEPTFAQLATQGEQEVRGEGVPDERIESRRALDLRYRGLDAYLTIPQPEDGNFAAAYAREHEQLYGYTHAARPLEIVAARVETIGRSEQRAAPSRRTTPRTLLPTDTATIHFDAQPHAAGVFSREKLVAGDVVVGPAVIVEANATTVVDPGWQAECLTGGELLLSDVGGPLPVAVSTAADPVMLEIFNNQFAGIAEQMGITLRNTSSSVNVKERLDFSCAIFTARGDLVVNAPHIPVHLGAMGETVRRVILDHPELAPGDVIVTNDPYRGGSHLPDVTVVTPVHDVASGELLFFTASRAHHAEIGGILPGSMPPFSKNLAEEGVLLRSLKVVAAGQSRMDELRAILSSGPYPSRAVADNLADITAQIAANHQGARDLARLIDRYSQPVTLAYMQHIQAAAEQKLRQALARLPAGRREFLEHLDDGTPICVAIDIAPDAAGRPSATVDFTGTGNVLPGNLNANRAIVTSALLYCLRLLIDEDIPLNQGVLAPVQLILPVCFLDPQPPADTPPEACPAVVGGNVETSQRVVDAILGALGLAAASQGTMNNLLFGDATFGYYETICGGSGATPIAPGASAVQTHMTNTRLTDPEVFERRFPVRILEFSLRHGSGGAGTHRGGDGIVRRLEFLRPLAVSILSQRRGPYPPYGLAGGAPGALGRNTLRRATGALETLPAQTQFTAHPGDTLKIETPGGGGYGPGP